MQRLFRSHTMEHNFLLIYKKDHMKDKILNDQLSIIDSSGPSLIFSAVSFP